MKDSGSSIRKKERVNLPGLMVHHSMEIGFPMKDMDREITKLPMIQNMLENGNTIKGMERGN